MEKNKCNCGCTTELKDPNCKCVDECHCNDEKSSDECCCGCVEDQNKSCCEHSDKKSKKEEKNKYKKEIEILKEKNKTLEQEILIAKADLINYRKRKDEEVIRLLKYCNEDLIKNVLPVLDNFERAIKMDDDNLEDELSRFLEGFKMIYCNMNSVMDKFEVRAIDTTNKEFDPIYHNAIMTEKREGVEPGMVIEVLQKGYMYKDKVIRPAMVKVSE